MAVKKRRAHGSGGVTRRKDGYWIGRYDDGYTPSGSRRRRTVTAKTKAEAERRLRDAIRSRAEHDDAGDANTRTTVRGWAEVWLPMHQDKVAPGTFTTNAGAVRKWVIPTIGHKRLTALTPADIRAIRTAIIDAGLSTTTARQAQSTARTMLRAARLEGHNVPPRVFDVEVAPVAKTDRDAIPLVDAEAILTAAAQDPQELARWSLALLAGLRPAEARGLRWSEVDLAGESATIEWQLQQLPYLDRSDKDQGFRVPVNHESVHLYLSYHLTRPKNRRGLRVIPLLPLCAEALRQWKAVAPANPWDLVFTEEDGRSGRGYRIAWSKHTDATHWSAVQTAAGVTGPGGRPYANYENRHTTATLLMQIGTPTAIIEQIVGHSELVSKRTYQHVSQAAAREWLVKMGGQLNLPRIGQ